jgi:exonuclease III
MTEKYCIRIIQWNCFSLTIARIEELRLFLKEAQPDIMSIQETKLNDEKANLRLRFSGYIVYHKQRKSNPDFGGGVALLVKEGITHTLVENLAPDSEVLGINIDYGKTKFNLLTYYNPPNLTLDRKILQTLVNLEDDVIVVGDLNACAKSFGCKRNNDSGHISPLSQKRGTLRF